MWSITSSSTAQFTSYVTGASVAFLPLMAVVTGVFLAFAIANMLRHFILKTTKSK